MLLGYPSYIRRGFTIPALFAQQPYYEAFIQDDWRATDKLTVNVGLRWESGIRPWDANNALGNLLVTRDAQRRVEGRIDVGWCQSTSRSATGQVNSPPQDVGYRPFADGERHEQLRSASRPRLPAYRTGRCSARAWASSSTPRSCRRSTTCVSSGLICHSRRSARTQAGQVNFSITDPGPGFGSTQAIGGWPQNPDNRTPYSQQWNFMVQHQLMDDIAVDVGYVGFVESKADRLSTAGTTRLRQVRARSIRAACWRVPALPGTWMAAATRSIPNTTPFR